MPARFTIQLNVRSNSFEPITRLQKMINAPHIIKKILPCFIFAYGLTAQAQVLITEKEAALPAGSTTIATRAITRGPAIHVISPDPASTLVKSPFALKVGFEPRGGAKIDPTLVKVVYLRSPAVDLSDRIKVGLTEKGITLESAQAPIGDHQIRVTVQDSEGRQTSQLIAFTVVK